MKIPTPEFINKDQLNRHERLLVKSALVSEDCELFDKKMVVAGFGELRQAEAKKPEPERRGRATLWSLAIREQAKASAAPTIRADLIRFLARGGNDDYPVDPYGVRLTGARITGTLTLEGCRDLRTLNLNACHFDEAPILRDAAGQVINFSGSHLPGLRADRLTTTGDVLLRQGFEAAGAVQLLGAKIGGSLDCSGGNFLGKDKKADALIADGLTTTGNVFLNDGFEAAGAVRLVGAKIGGNLECTGGKFSGEPSALILHRGCVTGVFHWKTAKRDRPTGTVDLSSAEVGDLSDDLESWPECKVILDGFRYGRISGAPTSYAMRKEWLERQRTDHLTSDFKPQPFEQLAQVLREMGHTEDAKRVAMLKQRYQRRATWLQAKKQWREATHKLQASWNLFTTLILGFFSLLFQGVVGFGYRPFRALWWLAGFWLAGFIVFSWADQHGAMVPNEPRILNSDDWIYCLWQEEAEQVSASECWRTMKQPLNDFLAPLKETKTRQPIRGEDFPPFSPTAYAFDTFVPFVNLDQEKRWTPQAERGKPPLLGKPTGWWARLYLWFHIVFGWIITALFAASLTGLVKKDV